MNDNGAADQRRMLADSVADYCRRSDPLHRARALRDTDPGFDRAAWQEMAELGWTGLVVPEDCGGLGLTVAEHAIVAGGAAAVLMPEPLTAAMIATRAIAGCPEGAIRSSLLARIASGAVIPSLAWQEAAGDVDPLNIATTATPLSPPGDANNVAPGLAPGLAPDVALQGTKRFVVGAAGADGYVLSVREGPHPALYWVEAAQAGVRSVVHRLADGRPVIDLHFERAEVPASNRLAIGDEAVRAVAVAVDDGNLALAAELLGLSRRLLEVTLDYLRTRSQFGRAIGAFQSLQHRAVDLYIHQRIGDATLDQALQAAAAMAHGPLRSATASRAKARACETARRITREAIQMHGAIGFTDDCDVGLYVKRSLVLSGWLGNARLHRGRHAALVPLDAAAASADMTIDQDPGTHGEPRDWDALGDDAFRMQVRTWLQANCPPQVRFPAGRMHWHECRDWWAMLYRKGWIAPGWPTALGGMGLSPFKQIIMADELERHGCGRMPDQGITQVGPILIRYGTPEQQSWFLPRTLSGEAIWCQGYSEPNAGSDLASLQTAALEDGDDYVIDGSKIWTTLAMDATHMYVLVRTGRGARKQEGISFLLLDMKSPGITVRPIRNIAGDEEFCQVFFDSVRTPKTNLVGTPGQGWTIAKSLLGFERLGIGSPRRPQLAFARLEKLARARGLFDDPVFMDRFNALRLDILDLSAAYEVFVEQVRRGEPLGPDVSLLKIWATETMQLCSELMLEAGEEYAALGGDADVDGTLINVLAPFYSARPGTIYGGSNEIQRNILAKAVLGLPQ